MSRRADRERAASERCPLEAALVVYRRGDVAHSADELFALTAGGPTLAERSTAVLAHLRTRAVLP